LRCVVGHVEFVIIGGGECRVTFGAQVMSNKVIRFASVILGVYYLLSATELGFIFCGLFLTSYSTM